MRVQETVQGLPRIEAASDFTDGVWARIHAAESAPRRVFAARPSGGWLVASFRPALAAAAGLAVVFTVVAYVNRQPSPVSRVAEPMASLEKPAPAPSIASVAPGRAQTSPSARLERQDVVRETDQKKEVEPAVEKIRFLPDDEPLLQQPSRGPMSLGSAIAATPGDTSGLDSLFNHDYDVEFALDPVHLKRVPGQKRLTPARPAPTEEVGKRASVTF